MTIDFYKALEEKFRGSRAFVKSRLEIYLPFIKPLLGFYPDAQVIDLGCGRGEWLELLNENGFSTCGVDLNQDMLEPARQAGLNVHYAEAISYLKQLPDQSQVVVSSFHLVEHIPFEAVETLVQEALRVLRPGGILIMETPNPENIMVGTADFYIDPTHKNPLPPKLLALLPEHYGFKKTKLLRLQENTAIKEAKELGLIDVLCGVSPDCAVVAQKEAEKKLFSANDQAFAQDYGVTLEKLAAGYDQQFIESIRELKPLTKMLCSFEASRMELNKEYKTLLQMVKKAEAERSKHNRQLEKLTLLLQNSKMQCAEQAKEIDSLRRSLKKTGDNSLEIQERANQLSQTNLFSDPEAFTNRFEHLKKLANICNFTEEEQIKALEYIVHYANLDKSQQVGWKAYLPRSLFLFLKKSLYFFRLRKAYEKLNGH